METNRAKEFFKSECEKRGIKSVNEHTAFRWDEVVSLMQMFANSETSKLRETNKGLVEALKNLLESNSIGNQAKARCLIEEISSETLKTLEG